MRYIRIDPESLTTEVLPSRSGPGIFVPVRTNRKGSVLTDMLHYTAYFDVLYPVAGPRQQKGGARVSASLLEPDPWFVALVALMWQGLVQGLTWDAIKASCLFALDKLRKKRLAPPVVATVATRRKKCSATQIGFSYTKFADDGRPLYELFLGVKRRFRRATETERREIPTAKHLITSPRPNQAMERTADRRTLHS
jgi:hypothetical protein